MDPSAIEVLFLTEKWTRPAARRSPSAAGGRYMENSHECPVPTDPTLPTTKSGDLQRMQRPLGPSDQVAGPSKVSGTGDSEARNAPVTQTRNNFKKMQ